MDNFSKVLYFLCLLKCLILTLYTVSACEPGWFGDRCSYMCHCVTTCDRTGECSGTNNTCVRGWFGYKCQYHDLLTLPTLIVESSLNQTLDKISDRDDMTCLSSNSALRNLTFKWNTSYVFTWLRLVVNNENLSTSFSIEFGQDTKKLTCNNRRLYIISNLSADIRCDVIQRFNQITVTGLGLSSLCSMYINGGRNIALKQQTSMSSVYENFTSSKAVDGNTDGNFYQNSCIHTALHDTSPWWRVNFTNSVITRYIVHNRVDSNSRRLSGFTLVARLENAIVFSYYDNPDEGAKQNFIILDDSRTKVSTVYIYGNKSKDVLHFCEVEIFGECAAGTWGINCTKCPSRCPLTCNVDNGRCSTVCYGHSNPPNCTQGCSYGWFGSKCQYLCHCDSIGSCDVNGLCSTKCASGWFGLNCQYQDLATVPGVTLSTTPVQTTPTWLTDSDDLTCNVDQNIRSLRVLWNTTYPFTWMRVKLRDSIYIQEISIDFRLANNVTFSCNVLVTTLDSTTVDYRCDLSETIQELTVTGTGLKSLCSLYICGGRNVALKQAATQTSSYGNYPAHLAVDGNTSRHFYDVSCSHTGDKDLYPSWTLALDSARSIQRFVFYNRDGVYSERLKHFKLETLDSSNKVVWTYKDTRVDPLSVYTVTSFKANNVSKLRMYPTYLFRGEPNPMLTLCEVELYGECAPGLWGLECNLFCPRECSSWCHKDTGLCPSCFGYNDPPLCKKACLKGYHGLNCQNKCSSHCYNNSCDRLNGACNNGCLGYSDPPDCNIVCQTGRWGKNCQKKCRSNCYGVSCDIINGLCVKGCNGYNNPPKCDAECRGTWGPNCQFTCRTNCYNNSCDKITGVCSQGCNGFMDPPDCLVKCKVSTWGHNCENTCSAKCIGRTCNTVSGLCDANCNILSCPTDCPQGFYGENCTLECSSACKDFTCSDYGYCVSCLPGLEGNFCKNAKKEISFQEGIGIGFAACAACSIIVFVVVIVACRRRMKQPKTKSRQQKETKGRQHKETKGRQQNMTSRETNFTSNDGVRPINEYPYSYESPRLPSKSKVPIAAMEIQCFRQSVEYQNLPGSIYETFQENMTHV